MSLDRNKTSVVDAIDAGLLAGAVTLVWHAGEVLQVNELGYRDVEAQLPMQRDTIFRIASMTKPVTVAAAMSMIEEGKLSLTDRVAGLGARVDEVGAEARRQIETAQATVDTIQAEATTAISAAARSADFAQVQAAMAAGLPFAEPLDRLAADPRLQIPEALNAAAASGIESLAELRDGFADSAHGAIRASILASSGDGVIARSRAFLEAQVATRSLTPQEGQGTDAVLSRMEEKLRQDDLNGVLTEAGQLPSEAAQAMSGWLAALKLRADAEAGLSALNAELPATN